MLSHWSMPHGFRLPFLKDERMSTQRLNDVRILMYSHDTFGLGHFRRCRAIAHAIVDRFKGVSVLIITGSQIAGAFDFKARVDFVKIPSVIKLYNGEYDSIGEYIEVDEILEMRQRIIHRTAEAFRPDVFIVDKEPLGLKGELLSTLEMLKKRDTQCVLGLRDVMDSPQLLVPEWQAVGMLHRMERYFDHVWAYGPKSFWDPLSGFHLSKDLAERVHYTGFLKREQPAIISAQQSQLPEDYILVTAGGGGDGSQLMEQVLAARVYMSEDAIPLVMVLGPFMKTDVKDSIRTRAAGLPNVTILDFASRMESIMANASGIVGMCGYNTFCEVLSYDQRALFVPRVKPREEQFIRARRANELDLADMLLPEQAAVPELLAKHLKALPNRVRPSHHIRTGDMAGLDRVCEDIRMLCQHTVGHLRAATDAAE